MKKFIVAMMVMMAFGACAPAGDTGDTGTTASPEISVSKGLTQITSGLSYTNDFGTTAVGETGMAASFMVYSAGTADLIITSIVDDSAEFTTTTYAGNLSTNGSQMFYVTNNATTAGTNVATISIANNDSDENPFTFTVIAIVTN